MSHLFSPALRRVAAAALAATCLGATGVAHGANHALIFWIGDYGNPRANLPGIDLDAAMARKIAKSMGVPETNMREVSNAALTKSNISSELGALTSRIAPGDNVFIYYSGHGGQVENRSGSGGHCTEGLITRDPAMFEDGLMEQSLSTLGDKAGQVVFLNDSCFSGGAATKAVRLGGVKAKFFPDTNKLGSVAEDNHRCGNAVNKMARTVELLGTKATSPRVLYVAAASATEVAGATPDGSVATLAWASCLGASADTDRSGSINGEELRQCAQNFIDKRGGRTQTITVVGNSRLPLAFTSPSGSTGGGSSAGTTTTTTTPATPAASEEQPVNPLATLNDLRAAGSGTYKVSLSGNSPLRIGQDFLDFSVTTNKGGYLYVLHVGSDGKTFDLLFPNKLDEDNQIQAGTTRLPRPSWRVRAAGPAGTSHVLAIVSPTKKEIGKAMDLSQTFPSAKATAGIARTLVVEAVEGQGNPSAFGTSNILVVQER